jgi:Phasin protein
MSTEHDVFAAGEPQKALAGMLASTVCNGGTEALLDAQTRFLKGAETVMTEWLHRRQEAVAEAQRLIFRLRDSSDFSEILKAEQDWAEGALRRFAADATDLLGATLMAPAQAAELARGSMEAAAEEAPPARHVGAKAAKGAVETVT